jgi:hypothetical protein
MTFYIERNVGSSLANRRRFVFPPAALMNISTTIEVPDLNETVMPSAGPMSNFGFDFNGVNKTITVNFRIHNLSSGSAVQALVGGDWVDVTPPYQTIEQMKYWLEALIDGAQNGVIINIPLESLSVQNASASETTILDNNTLVPAQFTQTRGFVKSLTYNNSEDKPVQLEGTISFFVCDASLQ